MIELGGFGKEPELAPAVLGHDYGQLVFGTMAKFSREQAEERRTRVFKRGDRVVSGFEHNWPEIWDCMHEQSSRPSRWRIRTSWESDYWDVAKFVGLWFEMPHQFKWPGGVPLEVGVLLSSILQLGDKPTFRNFKRHLDLSRPKFLPFVITPDAYRFFIYEPTQERYAQAEHAFHNVLEELRDLESAFPLLLWQVYALVRLDEVKLVDGPIASAREALEHKTLDLRRCLSFVYEPFHGSKDVVRFEIEMFGLV